MSNYIYFVPREGSTTENTSSDDCLVVAKDINKVHLLRSRLWDGLLDEIEEIPFSETNSLARNFGSRVYQGIGVEEVETTTILDQDNIVNSSRPRPVNFSQAILVDDPIVIDVVNFIART